jgi:integrase/recombinase XerD
VLFEQFLAERRYLRNVTTSTLEWYETAFKSLQKHLGVDVPPLSKSNLQGFVVAIRQRGVKAVSCNTYIKAVNAFCLWLHNEGHHAERLQLPLLKIEQRVIQTLSDESMRTLVSQKPRTFDQWRLHALVCLLLDTGLRIDEALTLRKQDVDFDNLLVTVFGKGRKERRIPFSLELRKVLFRYERVRARQCPRCELVSPPSHSSNSCSAHTGRRCLMPSCSQDLSSKVSGCRSWRHRGYSNRRFSTFP